MGPYVIHNLSTSGVVHLETLEGERMANWISGCRLKKYHETLTPELLERLHAAKARKQNKQLEKQQAQAEAKERVLKFRRKRNIGEHVTISNKKLKIC